MSKDFILYTKENNKLNVTTYGFENRNNAPCLIYVHGFKGFKDWGFVPYAAEYFASKGYFVVTFNFSHNGVGDALTKFVEMEKFAANTYSLEVSELKTIIEAYEFGFFENDNANKIGLIGHSRGGGIALLTSLKVKQLSAIALWASIARIDRYSKRQKELWKNKGALEVLNKRTKQVMKLNYSLLKDIEENKDKSLNIKRALKKFDKPLLIIHGDQDLSVPIKEAADLYLWSNNEKSELYMIKNTGHTFNIVHPFAGSSEKFEEVLQKTESFFKINLF